MERERERKRKREIEMGGGSVDERWGVGLAHCPPYASGRVWSLQKLGGGTQALLGFGLSA